ncbi:MAG: inositol monophosphatase family protein [Candidatus Moraniibacteriota bacterium]
MEKIQSVAIEAAKDAGVVLNELFASRIKRYEMKTAHDILAEADVRSEDIILGRIRQAFPEHAILSEEAGENGKDSEYKWIVDPVDGTINFSRGIDEFCISIAVSRNDELAFGLIYEPIRDRLYIGKKGEGATMNGVKMNVSTENVLVNTILATDNSSDMSERVRNLELLARISPEVRHVRIFGSAALHLARVAKGEIDAYYKTTCNYWDNAAGMLLLQEAGGRLTDLTGSPLSKDSRTIVASNGLVHDEILALLSARS